MSEVTVHEENNNTLNDVIFPTHDDWIHRDFGFPAEGMRVLTYSQAYDGIDDSMLYRIMDSRFVRISSEVTHWKLLFAPSGINNTGFSNMR